MLTMESNPTSTEIQNQAEVAKLLYTPSDTESHNLTKFQTIINTKYNLNITNYSELYRFSIDNLEQFWANVLEYFPLLYTPSSTSSSVVTPYTQVLDNPRWFPDLTLNYGENLLSVPENLKDKVAIYYISELQEMKQVTYRELWDKVEKCYNGLKKLNVTKGDRVVGYLPNGLVAVVAMLATNALGAIWSCTSPDFGPSGVLDRFQQIEPKVLFSCNAIVYNQKVHDHLEKLKTVVSGLNLTKVIVDSYVSTHPTDLNQIPNSVDFETFLNSGDKGELKFERLPLNHPIFILFSSGTTGKPKCLVHTSGLLIQHVKEHGIHGNLNEKDILFQYTTTGWMMWNWLVSGLALNLSIVLYDGSPFQPNPNFMFQLIDELNITAFGTSAKYIQSLQDNGIKPNQHFKLDSLHSLYSTGSPLKPESFDFVYQNIKSNLLLGSITGGTDICSLFAGHNSTLPVYRGEIQCRMLGMAIDSWSESRQSLLDEPGDLVCTLPFPAMPVYFWNDTDNQLYSKAYFQQFEGVWSHGDFVSISSKTGGLVMLGRSDGTLNPSGVRFGSAEIYNIIEAFDEIEDSIVVGQKIPDDERVILFLKAKPNHPISVDLIKRIKLQIRTLLSPRHVPAVILPIQEIPYTINGKKVEVAVKKVINNTPLEKISTATLTNPEVLKLYANLEALKL